MQNIDFELISAEQARLIAEPKEKTLKDIMWSVDYWAKKGDHKIAINTKEFYITDETRQKLIELGYRLTNPTSSYHFMDISWQAKS